MADNAQDPSLRQKKSARRRLVGAAVLCIGLAVALPFVFDAEPKRDSKPQEVSVTVALPKPPPADANTDKVGEKGGEKGGEKNASKAESKDLAKPDQKPVAEAALKEDAPVLPPPSVIAEPAPPGPVAAAPPVSKPSPEVTKKPATSVSDVIAQAEKTKKPTASTTKTDADASKSSSKYLIQIGAFGSSSGAEEQVKRAAAAGQKAFTEEVTTGAGKRIRVRVGPFGSREQAEKARENLKAAGIESALIAQ